MIEQVERFRLRFFFALFSLFCPRADFFDLGVDLLVIYGHVTLLEAASPPPGTAAGAIKIRTYVQEFYRKRADFQGTFLRRLRLE